MMTSFHRFSLCSICATLILSAGPTFAFDAVAAKELAKSNDCFKCHAPDKTKKGPSYKKLTAKYKGKEAEGEAAMIKNMTTAPMVKLEDGTEEKHKVIDTKDPAQMKNLVQWILSHK